MESMTKKTPMPVAAGALAIASGGLKLLGLLGLMVASFFIIVSDLPFSGVHPVVLLLAIVVPLATLGIIAIIGGISALQRRHFNLALAGSIMAFLPFSFLGLASITLLALPKEEFKN